MIIKLIYMAFYSDYQYNIRLKIYFRLTKKIRKYLYSIYA